MSGDLIAGLLGKLSERTGREWTLADLMELAKKMSQADPDNIDSVLDELEGMGLNLSDETKERVKNRMKNGDALSVDDLEKITPRQVKGKSRHVRRPVKAVGKSKHLPLAQRIKQVSGKRRKKP